MITEKNKEFLGKKVKFDGELGVIVGLAEIPSYSPYDYTKKGGGEINSEIDRPIMFIVSLESGKNVFVAPCRVVVIGSFNQDWVITDINEILEVLRDYKKREINKIKSVGARIRGKFLKYPKYDRFVKNLENLKLEEVLWEKI